jgi:hypothetical protein
MNISSKVRPVRRKAVLNVFPIKRFLYLLDVAKRFRMLGTGAADKGLAKWSGGEFSTTKDTKEHEGEPKSNLRETSCPLWLSSCGVLFHEAEVMLNLL